MAVEFTIYPATTRVMALARIGPVSEALGLAHGMAMHRAVNSSDTETANRALGDAARILEAQANLISLEMFLHNLST